MTSQWRRGIAWLAHHRTGLAFSLAVGFLLAITLIGVSARRLAEEYSTVRHTTDVLISLDAVLSAVTDGETGQRGFLLTGEERYLTPYLHASEMVATELKALRALAAGNTRRQHRLEVLEPVIAEKMTELRDTLELRRARGSEVALQRVLTGRGLRLMEDLRSNIASMKAEERKLLTEQSARYAEQARRVSLALLVLAAATFLILGGLIWETRRRARELKLTRDTLQTHVAQHEETRSLLDSLVQSSPDAIIGQDLDGQIIAWNTGAERLYGFTAHEVLGRSIGQLVSDGSTSGLITLLDQARRNGGAEHLEAEHTTKDGRKIHVALMISPIKDPAQTVIGVSILSRDVTAQKLAEDALRRSEALSRAFLESASESIVVTDAEGRIVQVNARTETMFGYPRDELIGRPVELLIPTRLRDRHVGHRTTYMEAPRVRSMGQGLDLSGLKKDGTEFPVEVSLSYVHSAEGIRVIAFIIDISERVAFQRAARQADKLAALGTLSAGIAHEINNPVGIISSRVEVMLLEAEGGDLPAEIRKDLEVILRHARRVSVITQGLLSFARQSSGARAPVNLNRVAEEIFQLAQKDLTRGRIAVTLSLDETLPDSYADATAIGQVLLNLLTNARSAMPEGGEIAITTSYQPATRSVRLAVSDTGSGIPPEILPKIFDPFFTTRSDGTGLGLSISHGIVTEHHGTLTVRSEVGKGTTFTLTFPVDFGSGV